VSIVEDAFAEVWAHERGFEGEGEGE